MLTLIQSRYELEDNLRNVISVINLRSSSGLTIKEMRIEADPNDFK